MKRTGSGRWGKSSYDFRSLRNIIGRHDSTWAPKMAWAKRIKSTPTDEPGYVSLDDQVVTTGGKKMENKAVRTNWATEVAFCDDSVNYDHCKANFIQKVEGELVTQSMTICIEGSMVTVADAVCDMLTDTVITGTRTEQLVIEGVYKACPTLAMIRQHTGGYNEYGDDLDLGGGVGQFIVEVTADRKVIKAVFSGLDRKYGKKQYALVTWWHNEGGSTRNKPLFLPPVKTVLLPEFYPNMTNPKDYMQEYLRDEAAVLLVAGEPGTGKTTFLRHMIHEHKLKAHIVYDEALMKGDAVFQNFLFAKESDILIIEDADTILMSRDDDGNKLMARFLNVSDGLIKLPNKKVVFTTNISDFNRVDSALLRPGRCYDLLHTRKLNLKEAQAATRAASLPVPSSGAEFTLAELFNQQRKPVITRKVGFGR